MKFSLCHRLLCILMSSLSAVALHLPSRRSWVQFHQNSRLTGRFSSVLYGKQSKKEPWNPFSEIGKKDILEELAKAGLDEFEGLLDDIKEDVDKEFSSLFDSDGAPSSSKMIKDDDLFNSVVRVYCTHSEPNFNMPWQRMKQESSTSTGFVIEPLKPTADGKPQRRLILTNAHAVEYGSIIQVKKRQSEKKYLARVLAGISLSFYSSASLDDSTHSGA